MGFLGFIAILILVFLLTGVSLITSFLRALFGYGNRHAGNERSNEQSYRSSNTGNATGNRTSMSYTAPPRKKYFSKEDGEYVEFEEV
jgi:hypothetical protein